MKRIQAHQGRAAGILSAIFLCLTAALAVVYEPFADRTPSVFASKPVTGGMSVPDQRTTFSVPKRPSAAADWRSAEGAATQDDGKSKAALAPEALRIPVPGPGGLDLGFASLPAAYPLPSHRYEARAPPAFS